MLVAVTKREGEKPKDLKVGQPGQEGKIKQEGKINVWVWSRGWAGVKVVL
jgi:hypothetical protein